MTSMTITCANCGGTDFQLIIFNLKEETQLQCVRHDEHVEQLRLREKRRQVAIEHGLDPDRMA